MQASPSVRCVRRPLDRLPGWSRDLRCLVSLLTCHDSKLDRLSVAHRADRLARVVSSYSRLVHEHILTRVSPVDEAVAAFHVEPFHDSGHFLGDHFFLLVLLFDRGLVRTGVDVCHDVLAMFSLLVILMMFAVARWSSH